MTDWAIRLHAPTISFHLRTNGGGGDIVKGDEGDDGGDDEGDDGGDSCGLLI